ncbi:MAG: sodium:proline symporter [Verrucomicrobiaceae bacterium]|nr:MAG: sodium:proline symporter [Verrucomicrobiaceae bacterium]
MHPAQTWFNLAVDGAVILVYFVGIVGIGLHAARKNTSLKDFSLGGHSIPWWAVLASIIAAETSAVTFLGAPAEGFKTRSYAYAQLAIGTIIARVIIAWLFIAPYYRYKVESIYEFLTLRFGERTKNMASGIFLATRVLGIGVRLYLGGVIMVVVYRYLFPGSEITIWTYFWGIVFVTFVTTLYTTAGGIKAVVWTDLIQACLMMGAILFSIVAVFNDIPGGMRTVHEQLAGQNLSMFQTGWDSAKPFGEALRGLLESEYTIFAALVGITFFTMATHGTDQDMVQRMLTAENTAKSRLSLILSGFADIPIVLSFLTVGILLYVRYQIHPDASLPSEDNEIFAHYIVNEMPVGIRGLIVAGVFATMMGSTSAALNALATSFIKDFYQPYIRPSGTDRQAVTAARWATSVFGVLMIVVATVAAYTVLHTNITIIPLALGILGYSYGSLLGVFLLGVLTRGRGDDRANVLAMIFGILAVLVLCKIQIPLWESVDSAGNVVKQSFRFGLLLPSWWPAIAWPYYVFIGCLVTFGFSILFPSTAARLPAGTGES